MGNLSKNFSSHEFSCKCRCGFDKVSPILIDTLQTIRDFWGKPININSGCRCQKHNDSIENAAPNSYHTKGRAVDIDLPSEQERDAFKKLVVKLYEQGKIPYLSACQWESYKNGCLHVDVETQPTKRLREFKK